MKKRILTVLITIITVIPLVLSVPKADTQVSTHTTTSYGDYTFQQGMSTTTFDYELTPLAINLTWNSGSWMKLDYNFKDKYSGTMKFTVTSSVDWILDSSPVYYTVYCDGAEATCYISSSTAMNAVGKTKTFSVIFTNATSIHFNVATGSSATFFNSSNTITISNASFTAQKDITDVYTDIHQLRTWWDLYIPGMSTNLGNISLGIDTIEQEVNSIDYYVNNDLDNHLTSMDSNIQTMTSDIALLKTYLDGVEGYIDTLETKLSTIQTYVSDISANVLGIYHQGLCEYWQLPAYIWAYKQQAASPSSKYSFDKYGRPYIICTHTIYDGLFTQNNSILVKRNSKYYIVFGSNKQFSGPGPTINVLPQNDSYPLYSSLINAFAYVNGTDSYYLYYIEIDNSYNLDIYCEIEFIKEFGTGPNAGFKLTPIFLGYGHNMPDTIRSMINLEYDNTYTDLLQQISNGISGSYDTSQYESYEQTIDSLNDSMRDRFNSSETSFQNNINSILTPDQTAGGSNTIFEQFNFNVINGVFTSFLGQLFNAAPLLQYLLLFSLLLLVLGVFI